MCNSSFKPIAGVQNTSELTNLNLFNCSNQQNCLYYQEFSNIDVISLLLNEALIGRLNIDVDRYWHWYGKFYSSTKLYSGAAYPRGAVMGEYIDRCLNTMFTVEFISLHLTTTKLCR